MAKQDDYIVGNNRGIQYSTADPKAVTAPPTPWYATAFALFFFGLGTLLFFGLVALFLWNASQG